MRIVVIGGSGLVGAKLVSNLRHRGHDVVSASRRSGVDTITGEGLAQALAGAQVVVDVTNSDSFDNPIALDFFQTSSRNLAAAEASCARKAPCCVVDRGHRPPARKRLLPGEDGAGGAGQSFSDSSHHPTLDSVL